MDPVTIIITLAVGASKFVIPIFGGLRNKTGRALYRRGTYYLEKTLLLLKEANEDGILTPEQSIEFALACHALIKTRKRLYRTTYTVKGSYRNRSAAMFFKTRSKATLGEVSSATDLARAIMIMEKNSKSIRHPDPRDPQRVTEFKEKLGAVIELLVSLDRDLRTNEEALPKEYEAASDTESQTKDPPQGILDEVEIKTEMATSIRSAFELLNNAAQGLSHAMLSREGSEAANKPVAAGPVSTFTCQCQRPGDAPGPEKPLPIVPCQSPPGSSDSRPPGASGTTPRASRGIHHRSQSSRPPDPQFGVACNAPAESLALAVVIDTVSRTEERASFQPGSSNKDTLSRGRSVTRRAEPPPIARQPQLARQPRRSHSSRQHSVTSCGAGTLLSPDRLAVGTSPHPSRPKDVADLDQRKPRSLSRTPRHEHASSRRSRQVDSVTCEVPLGMHVRGSRTPTAVSGHRYPDEELRRTRPREHTARTPSAGPGAGPNGPDVRRSTSRSGRAPAPADLSPSPRLPERPRQAHGSRSCSRARRDKVGHVVSRQGDR